MVTALSQVGGPTMVLAMRDHGRSAGTASAVMGRADRRRSGGQRSGGGPGEWDVDAHDRRHRCLRAGRVRRILARPQRKAASVAYRRRRPAAPFYEPDARTHGPSQLGEVCAELARAIFKTNAELIYRKPHGLRRRRSGCCRGRRIPRAGNSVCRRRRSGISTGR